MRIQNVNPYINLYKSRVTPAFKAGNPTQDFLMRSVEGFYLQYGREINKFLRNGKGEELPIVPENAADWVMKLIKEKIAKVTDTNKAVSESVKLIDSKITSKTNRPMTVYRDAPASWLQTAENGIITDKAFCSTSTEAGASMEGIIGSNAHLNKRYEIKLPEGTPFWDLTRTSEKEMLLPRNSKFKILDENTLELIL